MSKYTDDDIRNMKKVTCAIAGEYLGIAPMAVSIGMRNNKLPIGFAEHKNTNRWGSETWSYVIVPERLIAYKHGTLSEMEVSGIEERLDKIADQFGELKKEMTYFLRYKGKK